MNNFSSLKLNNQLLFFFSPCSHIFPHYLKTMQILLDVVVHVCNPSIQEAEAKGPVTTSARLDRTVQ